MIFGEGDFLFEYDDRWALEAKQNLNIKVVAGITVDTDDNIYVLTRSNPPVIILNKSGKVIESFGDNIFGRAHGMYRDKDGSLFAVDDAKHCVYKFNQNRDIIMTLGREKEPSDTGYSQSDNKNTVLRSSGPFNRPTRLVTDKDGNIYVTDGYGNARVHKFNSKGKILLSWGEPGNSPGQFNLPHGIGIDRNDLLYIADRQNNRVQCFTREGSLVNVYEDFHRPSDIWVDKDNIIYVSECMRTSYFNTEPSRITIMNDKGEILARIGTKGDYYDEPTGFRSAHGIAVDSSGNIYIGNVGKRWPDDYSGLYKYTRI